MTLNPGRPAAGGAPAPRPARGRGWPIAMGIILGATVALNVYVMRLAKGDPAFAVEPDYYQRAVRYDDEIAQRRRNAELGWRLEPALVSRDGGDALLRVRLADAAGAPVTGATLSVEAFPIVRSTETVRATLEPSAHGDGYEVRLPMGRAGRWELRFAAAHGGERFTAVERIEIAP